MKKTIHIMLFLGLFCSARSQAPMLFRLQANGNGMQNETVVYFDSSATYAYNPLFDAPSLGADPGQLNIVTCFDSIDYQVKALPCLNQGIIIPLKITTGISGSYQVHAQDLQNLPSGACIMLYDAYSGTSHDLRSGDYSCTISDTESISRFSVNIIVSSISVPTSSFQDPTCSTSANGKIVAHATGAGPWNYYWKDASNNIIRTMLNASGSDTLAGLGSGFYRLDLNAAGTCSNATSEFTLKGTLSPKASFVSDTTATIFSGVHFTNNSSNAVSYSWQFGDGVGSSYADPTHNYSATNVYTITLSAFSSFCNELSICTRTLTVVGSAAVQNENGQRAVIISRDIIGYYVEADPQTNAGIQIFVSDISGKNILTLAAGPGLKSKVYLDLEHHRNSMVLVSVYQGSGCVSKKLIVE